VTLRASPSRSRSSDCAISAGSRSSRATTSSSSSRRPAGASASSCAGSWWTPSICEIARHSPGQRASASASSRSRTEEVAAQLVGWSELGRAGAAASRRATPRARAGAARIAARERSVQRSFDPGTPTHVARSGCSRISHSHAARRSACRARAGGLRAVRADAPPWGAEDTEGNAGLPSAWNGATFPRRSTTPRRRSGREERKQANHRTGRGNARRHHDRSASDRDPADQEPVLKWPFFDKNPTVGRRTIAIKYVVTERRIAVGGGIELAFAYPAVDVSNENLAANDGYLLGPGSNLALFPVGGFQTDAPGEANWTDGDHHLVGVDAHGRHRDERARRRGAAAHPGRRAIAAPRRRDRHRLRRTRPSAARARRSAGIPAGRSSSAGRTSTATASSPSRTSRRTSWSSRAARPPRTA
jgi:hypothetical protein